MVRLVTLAGGCIVCGRAISATAWPHGGSDLVRGRNPRVEAVVDSQLIILAIVVPVMMVCVVSLLSIVLWLYARHREREAFYRGEAMKKAAESAGGTVVLEMMREQERAIRRTRRDGQRLGGLIAIAMGGGLMAFLHGVAPSGDRMSLVGLIPLLVGVALLAHGLVSRERE
jgi:hypothetical protein